MVRGAWQATVHGVARVRHDLATKPPPSPNYSIEVEKAIPGDVAEPGLEQDFRTSTSIVVFMFFFKLNLTQAETSY